MTTDNNIFLSEFNTPHGYIPFDRISKSDYEPAIMQGIALHDQEVNGIASQTDEPTFENTILALERSGEVLNRVLNVFFPMLSACADDDMMALSQKLAPVIADHANNITLNEDLWKRVKHRTIDWCGDASQIKQQMGQHIGHHRSILGVLYRLPASRMILDKQG